jgi:hypothetical protein
LKEYISLPKKVPKKVRELEEVTVGAALELMA